MTREAKLLPPYATDIIDVPLSARVIRAISVIDMDWNIDECYEALQGVEAPEGFHFRLHLRMERTK